MVFSITRDAEAAKKSAQSEPTPIQPPTQAMIDEFQRRVQEQGKGVDVTKGR